MKVGKTSFAAQAGRSLILATEKGTNAISGVFVAQIDSWTDFKFYLRELENPEIRSRYDTVTIDTISILRSLCEKYICSQHNVENLNEVPWGRAFKEWDKEFFESLLRITRLGLGLILIAHSEQKTVKETAPDGKEIETEYVSPALDARAVKIINPLVDIIGYISLEFDADGKPIRRLHTRSSPTVLAGSRFKYLPAVIPFGYDELQYAVTEAIKEGERRDGDVLTDEPDFLESKKMRPFSIAMDEAHSIIVKLAQDESNNSAIQGIIKEWFGNENHRLSTTSPNQQELLEGAIVDLKKLLDK